ncbi:MAG: ABC transporter ATP-binding protein [Saprospiraceae bacterium]
MKPILNVQNLWKQYKIGGQQVSYLSLRERLLQPFQRQQTNTFWALQGLNFDVYEGECIGIIGRNGAGKSTLLKVLSQITPPTKGCIKARGRVASLLEVGTGFHPELTGRENVYLNGSILGLKRAEIKAKFDEIIDFSGIEKFLDTPLKHYSSGMRLRLAFSVAAHLEPEILLIDEVLAVGDAEFQKKCLGKMDEVSKSGRTVIFVSHNLGAVRQLCSRGILLNNGSIITDANIDNVINKYLGSYNQTYPSIKDRKDRKGSLQTIITEIELLEQGEKVYNNSITAGNELTIIITYKSFRKDYKQLNNLHIGIAIFNQSNQFVSVLNNKMSNFSLTNRPLDGKVYCKIEKLPLMGGNFSCRVSLEVNNSLCDYIEDAFYINVLEGDYYLSKNPNVQSRQGVYINQSWY